MKGLFSKSLESFLVIWMRVKCVVSKAIYYVPLNAILICAQQNKLSVINISCNYLLVHNTIISQIILRSTRYRQLHLNYPADLHCQTLGSLMHTGIARIGYRLCISTGSTIQRNSFLYRNTVTPSCRQSLHLPTRKACSEATHSATRFVLIRSAVSECRPAGAVSYWLSDIYCNE
jgi:hypothetical protein